MFKSSRALDDNTVKYYLYPDISADSLEEVREKLNQYIFKSYANLTVYLTEYIWHYQEFQIKPVVNSLKDWHIEGSTNFGDNVEDEWFIVYLLYQLTQIDDKLVVRVEDNDGDFLLIEAADYLPKWVEPETSQNRVYLFGANLHLLSIKDYYPDTVPRIDDAIRIVRQAYERTKCEGEIQDAIKSRISGYPNRVKEMQHKVKCFVPQNVAAILQHEPSLVSSAVRAFYLRDPIDLQACRAMKYFPPENRVMRIVTMTRCLFAQLMGQIFKPDVKIGWNLPDQMSPTFKAYDLGMKIACGFEILAAQSCKMLNCNSEGNSDDIDFNLNPRWLTFFNSLKCNGYFGQELEGSKRYSELLINAKKYFYDVLNQENDNSLPKKVGNKLLSFFESKLLTELKEQNEKEDDDSWFNLNVEDFEKFLSSKFGIENNESIQSQIGTEITSSLSAFVDYEDASLKGAEPPNKCKNKGKTLQKVDFNEEKFKEALESVLSLNIPYDSDSGESSAMSDYKDDDSENEYEFSCHESNKPLSAKKEMEKMKMFMKKMDEQLSQTKVGQSFNHVTKSAPLATCDENDDSNEEVYAPLDVDLNTLSNILESYKSECGVPGPASTLFKAINLQVPENIDS